MEIPFKSPDFDLGPSARTIIVELMKKKGFVHDDSVDFSLEYFKNMKGNESTKKREDSLKYIFNKAISHLKKRFEQSKKFASGKRTRKQLNRDFYEHHFGAISRKMGRPIEAFYDYSLANNNENSLTSRSISAKYLSLIKQNRVFVGQIVEYLNRDFLEWFQDFNSKKIQLKVERWEEQMAKSGEQDALKKIVSKINSRNNKLFWTLYETRLARQIALKSLCLT